MFIKKDFSVHYLNALINPAPYLWVWPSQVVSVLDELGLFVRLFADFDFSVFSNESLLKKSFPTIFFDYSHFPSVKNAYDVVVNNGLFERRKINIDDLKSFIHDKYLPIIILGGKRLGHYVLLTGYDDNGFYYHDTTNKVPNKFIDYDSFIKLWGSNPLSKFVIVVFGKKFGDSFTQF